ncbi:hypothetical protein HHI36_016350 [Cryptolaemus montrouzieri]|uniref:Uncharacterized protein n=1 Tax=Cryptolaemus montrouzieri TaxID=559131 RepID=A0ABD2NJW3_9CUCU
MIFGAITSSEANYDPTPWWTDPCKHTIPPPVLERMRHGRSADNRSIILNQLNILINNNKVYLKQLGKLYTRIKDPNNIPEGRFKWLNITKLFAGVETAKGYNSKLKKLHNTMQLFGGVLEKLSGVQLRSHVKFNKDKRDDILYKSKLDLKAFICEVEEALINAKKTTKNIMLKDMKIPLPEQTNLTQMYVLDVKIFKSMKSFLILYFIEKTKCDNVSS